MQKFFTILVGALIALIFVSEVSAQIRRGHDKVVELTTQEASEMWSKFKSARIAGDYAMGFIITHSPRRGEYVEYVGEIFGTRRGDETLTRIRVKKVDMTHNKNEERLKKLDKVEAQRLRNKYKNEYKKIEKYLEERNIYDRY